MVLEHTFICSVLVKHKGVKAGKKELITYIFSRYIHESQQWAQKVQDTLDEVKLKEAVIFDYEKKISEADTKIHMQQKRLEALESDKITLEKMLLDAQVRQCQPFSFSYRLRIFLSSVLSSRGKETLHKQTGSCNGSFVRYEVPIVVPVKMIVFWDIISCSLVDS
jgi:hypothetical protein